MWFLCKVDCFYFQFKKGGYYHVALTSRGGEDCIAFISLLFFGKSLL